jgi:hypothetical protein
MCLYKDLKLFWLVDIKYSIMDIAGYKDLHINKLNRTNKYITDHVTDRLNNSRSFVFTKFGDGEYQCMAGWNGQNCDGDGYTAELGSALRNAFVSLCDMANDCPDDGKILLGRWHYPTEVAFCCDLYWNHQPALKREIPFVDYHLIYNDDYFATSRKMYDFVAAIQNYKHKKVLVTNVNNKRLVHLFRADDYIQIQSQSWHATQFDQIVKDVEALLQADPQTLVLIAGGLASKVLIARLCAKYSDASFLDIGSGFDIIATGRCTRDHKHTYEDELRYFSDLLPQMW